MDQHRKDAQLRHPEITLTQMYNVLEKVKAKGPHLSALRAATFSKGEGLIQKSRAVTFSRGEGLIQKSRAAALSNEEVAKSDQPFPSGEGGARGTRVTDEVPLTPEEKLIFDNALILILKELHEELDAAVADAYGWPVDLAEDEVLARLVALNKERAAEEAKGIVRWLRPEYQIPRFGSDAEKQQLEAFDDVEQKPAAAAKSVKPNFPAKAVDQVAAVMAALAQFNDNVSPAELARGFKQGKKCEARVSATLASLSRTGFIAATKDSKEFAIRRAG